MLKALFGCAVLALACSQAMAQHRVENISAPPASIDTLASSFSVNSDVMGVARAIVPSGWTGYAQRGIDLRRSSTGSASAGEAWTVALDRWLSQNGLTAQLDWGQRAFYLKASPSESVASTPVSKPVTQPQAAVAAVRFAVEATDLTVRDVLIRWSKDAGWSHSASHWTLPKDLPIQGTAGADVFGPDFSTAVRTLLSSTELTDYPAQPCFYSNHVVRVVPLSAICGIE